MTHTIHFRIRYSETDQMSYAYHGNYAQYFELGRIEWLRNLNISYKKMEEDGIMLPVINLNINYLKPAKYDDLVTLKTTLISKPTAKIVFKYELFNQENTLLTTGESTLVFIDIKKDKPCRIPAFFMQKIEGF